MPQVFLGLLLLALVLLNVWATLALVRETLSSIGQRAAQVVFVWLMPGIGAALALYLMRKDVKPKRVGDEFGREPGDIIGLDVAYGLGDPSYDSKFSDVSGGGGGDASSSH